MNATELKQDRVSRAAIWEPKKEALTEEIFADPFLQSKLEDYQEFSVKFLASQIADRKIHAAVYGPALTERYDNLQTQHVTYGFTLLELVLQKKLFNMQLEWRANRIRIPEIKIAQDFFAYASDILNCPFLEAITPDELEILKLYMKSYNFSTHVGWFGADMEWQNYRMLMQKDGSGDRPGMPDFYEFYDGHLGTFYLLDLPDKRGEQEARYLGAYVNKRREDFEVKEKLAETNPELKQKPAFLAFDPELQNRIFNLKEPEDFFEFKAVMDEDAKNGRASAIYEITEELDDVTDADISLPAHLPWDEALQKAIQDYRLTKSAEVLELTYEQYLMKAVLHLFDTSEIKVKLTTSEVRKSILEGRKILGEEENFEF